MADGRLYACNSPGLFAEQERRRDVLDAYNALPFSSSAERAALLAQLVAEAGEGSVFGAGSVVTRDVPAGVVAAGNPCRVLRVIGEKDERVYDRDKPVVSNNGNESRKGSP